MGRKREIEILAKLQQALSESGGYEKLKCLKGKFKVGGQRTEQTKPYSIPAPNTDPPVAPALPQRAQRRVRGPGYVCRAYNATLRLCYGYLGDKVSTRPFYAHTFLF